MHPEKGLGLVGLVAAALLAINCYKQPVVNPKQPDKQPVSPSPVPPPKPAPPPKP